MNNREQIYKSKIMAYKMFYTLLSRKENDNNTKLYESVNNLLKNDYIFINEEKKKYGNDDLIISLENLFNQLCTYFYDELKQRKYYKVNLYTYYEDEYDNVAYCEVRHCYKNDYIDVRYNNSSLDYYKKKIEEHNQLPWYKKIINPLSDICYREHDVRLPICAVDDYRGLYNPLTKESYPFYEELTPIDEQIVANGLKVFLDHPEIIKDYRYALHNKINDIAKVYKKIEDKRKAEEKRKQEQDKENAKALALLKNHNK